MLIFYSVQNCGDGSAYPMFLATQELADWDQEHMDEGWGEPCVGSLTIEVEAWSQDDQDIGLLRLKCPDMMDAVGYWLHRTEDEDYEPWELRDEFLAEFFPDGLPRFEVRIREDGPYYDIYVDGVKKGDKFGCHETKQSGEGGVRSWIDEATEAGRAALEERLNG